MPTFRPYSAEEIRSAAQAYGVNPDFAEAVYAAESSRGTDPRAMTARTIKRKRDSTIVRGPFQITDDTAADIIRKNKLGNVNVDDPDTHLDLAMRLMKELQTMYGGDFNKMAQAYLAGPGGVGKNVQDELGTTPAKYSNRILQEMASLRGSDAPTLAALPAAPSQSFDIPAMPTSSVPTAVSAIDDPYGIGSLPPLADNGPSWSDLVNDRGANGFELPPSLAAMGDGPEPTTEADLDRYIKQLVDEEMRGKDYAHA